MISSLNSYFCVVEIKRKWNLPSFQMWVSQTLGEKTTSATWKKQDHLKETRSLSLNFIFLNKTFTMLNNGGKFIVYSGKSAPEMCFKTPTECVKQAKCFILHKLSGWIYHKDGKRRAFCLTCGDKAVGRKLNGFTRTATFQIISSHYYVLI